MSACAVQLRDKEGNVVGGIVLLDQGHRQLACDWDGGCGRVAIAAVLPSTAGAAPQLACSAHLGRMHKSIWRRSNPPDLRVFDAAAILYRNDKVSAA